jgi:hypothetical protein
MMHGESRRFRSCSISFALCEGEAAESALVAEIDTFTKLGESATDEIIRNFESSAPSVLCIVTHDGGGGGFSRMAFPTNADDNTTLGVLASLANTTPDDVASAASLDPCRTMDLCSLTLRPDTGPREALDSLDAALVGACLIGANAATLQGLTALTALCSAAFWKRATTRNGYPVTAMRKGNEAWGLVLDDPHQTGTGYLVQPMVLWVADWFTAVNDRRTDHFADVAEVLRNEGPSLGHLGNLTPTLDTPKNVS